MKTKITSPHPPEKPIASDRLNNLIRTAALSLDPLARLKPLATKAGLSSAGIRAAIRRGYFTAGQASALELAVGRELLQKESLCPKYAK